jgi:NAD(P)-dependent dehydrogenase (short-subunit alcohol dehydrogenase family)
MAGLLDGKSALITGGGGGIGRATALAFAREGARVAVADVSAEAAGETVAQVNAAGGQAISLSGDVTRDADVRAMIEGVVGTYGRLDCAFNNAGIAGWHVEAAGKKTAEWSEEAFDRMIAVNLKGVWLCMRHELPQMQAQGGGNIVNTGSIAGLVGLPTSSAYVAAKHGVLGLTKTAAIEYAQNHIRVNAVCPGYIKTPMTEETMRRRGEAILAQVPFHRIGNPRRSPKWSSGSAPIGQATCRAPRTTSTAAGWRSDAARARLKKSSSKNIVGARAAERQFAGPAAQMHLEFARRSVLFRRARIGAKSSAAQGRVTPLP